MVWFYQRTDRISRFHIFAHWWVNLNSQWNYNNYKFKCFSHNMETGWFVWIQDGYIEYWARRWSEILFVVAFFSWSFLPCKSTCLHGTLYRTPWLSHHHSGEHCYMFFYLHIMLVHKMEPWTTLSSPPLWYKLWPCGCCSSTILGDPWHEAGLFIINMEAEWPSLYVNH